MGWQAWFAVAVVGLILFALIRGIGSPDVLMMGGAVLFGLTRLFTDNPIITVPEIFEGLSNPGMLTVAALFIVAAGLRETGVLDAVGSKLFGQTTTENKALLRLAAPVVGMSAFLNNTPVVAMLIPVVGDWCRKHRISPSRLLIPLSYLAILGGTCTLIGTSTNLLVNGMMIETQRELEQSLEAADNPDEQAALRERIDELQPMSLFELTRVGLPYALIGFAYLYFVARRLLPDRKDLLEQIGEEPRAFLVDMKIEPGCRLAGKTIAEAGLRRLPGLFLFGVTRDDHSITPVSPDLVLQEGDRLTFSGVVSTIVDLERIPGLVPAADEPIASSAAERRSRQYCQAVVSSTSPLINKNIREANFRARYNAAVIAVHRGGSRIVQRIGDIVLRGGDTLLLHTGPNFEVAHHNNPDFYLVSRIPGARPVRHDRAWISLFLLAVLIGLMAFESYVGMPIVLSAFAIAGLMIATRCISAGTARQSIDWQTLLTIVGAFGVAKGLQNSGAASAVAHAIMAATESLGPYGMLAAVYLIALLFTELITNNAAAVLIFPLAVALAEDAGLNPRPFAIAIAFAASASFATPIGYQTNMMVYGPGGYRFTDFLRVGVPLTAILFATAVVLIPLFWGF